MTDPSDREPFVKTKRRKTDQCIAKRIWEVGTPYIQSGGFLTILGALLTVAWTTFTFINNTEAYGPAIEDLQHKVSEQHDAIITMQQQIHWMYRKMGGQ
jgi:hypothetical protein